MDDPGESNRTPAFPWMVGAAAAQTPKTAPKRRQTMAEMLRSSELLGGTVALHEAVEAAQDAAARKAEASEPQAAGAVAPAPADVATAALLSVIGESPSTAPTPTPAVNPRAGGNRYNLYARVDGIWIWQFAVDAASHGEGLSQAVARLTSQQKDLRIRLEQDDCA